MRGEEDAAQVQRRLDELAARAFRTGRPCYTGFLSPAEAEWAYASSRRQRVNVSFDGGFETVTGMCMLTASGDSDNPRAVREAILDRAKVLVREGICRDDFLRMKRSALGRRIRDLDSFDSTCFRLCAYHLDGFDYFRFPEVYEQLESKEIQAFLQRVVTRDRTSMACI